MGGFANAPLALAVTQAGGLGMLGSVNDMDSLSSNLAAISSTASLPQLPHNLLPVGVGLLPFVLDKAKLESKLLQVLEKHPPAILWLFAAQTLSDYVRWTALLRSTCPHTHIWIQIGGSVSNALTVAEQCRPDALCIQGYDAGGHGFETGASLLSFFPEVADALAEAGYGHVPLLAAGGVSDARSAAAAFSLGAAGVVMGTRFLGAKETSMPHPGYRAAVLSATDGGCSTAKAKLFDNLAGPTIWPVEYDGRGLVTESWTDHVGGASIEDVRARYAEAVKEEGKGFGTDGKGRAIVWAGTGVGFVRREEGAKEIVEEVREGAVKVLEKARARM